MFRSTLIGLALEAALQEVVESRGYQVSAATRQAVWKSFDTTMQEELAAGALPGHTAKITSSSTESAQPTTSDEPPTSGVGSGFPAFRCVDGEWSIVIKDATVHMRLSEDKDAYDGAWSPRPSSSARSQNSSQTVKLDYLQIIGKEAESSSKRPIGEKRPRT